LKTELSPEYPEYLWYPAVLANVSYSSVYVAHKLRQHVASLTHMDAQSPESLKGYINEKLVAPALGIMDASDEELSEVAKFANDALKSQDLFARMISKRAQIGWSTHGHSAVDVNIYSSGGPGTEAIRGNVENTDVGKFLRDYIDVDVTDITAELQKKMRRKPKSTIEEAAKIVSAEHDHWVIHEDIDRRLEQGGITAF
jgi:alkaline phosphatase